MDESVAAQTESVHSRLQRVRTIIHEAIPDAEERISWSMPTFWKGTNLIHFAAFKKHINIYPGEEAAAAFAEQLTDYDVRKGAIRIYHDQELPDALIREIAQWCCESYVKRYRQREVYEGDHFMNWIAELLVLFLAFTFMVVPAVLKNPLSMVHDYPTDIYLKAAEPGLVKESQNRKSKKFLAKRVIAIVVMGLLFGVVVHRFHEADSFLKGAGYFCFN